MVETGVKHAACVVTSLYRSELPRRYDEIYLAERDEVWKTFIGLHEPRVGIKMSLLRQALIFSYPKTETARVASLFSAYFSQTALRMARLFESLGAGFQAHIGIGERELFLADILVSRLPEGIDDRQLHTAKSILLSELLGEEKTVDLIPIHLKPEFNDPKSNKYAAEIQRVSPYFNRVSEFTFRDIIDASLSGRIGFGQISRDELIL